MGRSSQRSASRRLEALLLWAGRLSSVGLLSLASGCVPETPAEVGPERGAPVSFEFPRVAGGSIDGASLRGRVTVLLFATSFDLNSLAAIRLLNAELESAVPRVNGVVVVLEPPKNVELVRTLADAEGVRATVAMADAVTLSGEGFFGRIRTVPTFVFLDREGRLVEAFAGVPARTELQSAIGRAR